jgi:type I restriction enzyme M protein
LKDPDNPNDNSWREIRAYGQEQKPLTATIARMNLFLHGLEEFRIVKDDTLIRPAFTTGGKLQTFDVVLANPPYGLGADLWSQAAFANDPYGRNFLGTPPASRADYAFIQHILKSMDENTGRCAILLPLGDLDRESETKIRENLVKSDLLEAVIGLGPNLFYNSPMEACIMICRSKKSDAAKGRVLFINAVKEVTLKNGESYLEPLHIKKIVDAYRNRLSDGILAYDADEMEIAGNEYKLSIPRYVSQSLDAKESINVAEVIGAWDKSDNESVSTLTALLQEMR